jgi:peroxiredoxin
MCLYRGFLVATFALIICLICAGSSRTDPDAPGNIRTKIADFTLKDSAGKPIALADFKDKKAIVVVFIGTECPVNNAYMRPLAQLAKEYADKGVQFLAINANRQDTADRIAKHAKEHAIPFPVLKDEGNVVADRFGAQRTPEAFVVDDQRVIRYQGRIDDQYGVGYQRPKPTRRDLAEALDELLAGRPVSKATTTVAGCFIARTAKAKSDGAVTYSKQVSRILQKHCQECHRPGMIGPMALLSYDDAAAWSETIREVVQDRRMPPWHADPKFGKFANDRSLPKEDRESLLAWIEQGCPKGDAKDEPPAREFASNDWTIGKPDVIFTMPREYRVPAQAPAKGVPYQYFIVPTNFNEDKWVQAVEAKPGNRAVVHHILVYARKLAKGDNPQDGIGDGLLVAQAPGELPTVLPPGSAKKIPKGSAIAFQMHYTPNGVEQTDRSSVGIIFAKEPPKHEIHTKAIANTRLAIPAGEANCKIVSARTFTQDTLVLSLFPHMHLRGKSFEYRLTTPDGKEETLLSVPRYDFGWQAHYRFEKPLRVPAGSRIDCTAIFDNSAGNPNNPDPTQPVRWGEQTWQEMMIGFVDYAVFKEEK